MSTETPTVSRFSSMTCARSWPTPWTEFLAEGSMPPIACAESPD